MVSTNRKALVRSYMREHRVKYTEALRALGSPVELDLAPRLQYMLLSWEQHDYDHPRAEGPAFETLGEAKAAASEDGDVVTSGFFSPDIAGGPQLWHSYPYGNASQRHIDPLRRALWGDEAYWNDAPRASNGWSRTWFQRFPTPKAAAASPALANGDATDGLSGDVFRFVSAEGSLVTRALPDLSIETVFSRFSDQRGLLAAEMERITATLDPRLGIRLREAPTICGLVQYWEFETPGLAGFVSWSSVDRHDTERMDALRGWIVDEFPHKSSVNLLPYQPLETCRFCENEPITRSHPLAPGTMIGTMTDSESVVDIEMPIGTDGPLTWGDFLLMHVYGGLQLVSHDGCAAYWSE